LSQNGFAKLILIGFGGCLQVAYSTIWTVTHLTFVGQQPKTLNFPKLYLSRSRVVLALQVSQKAIAFKTQFAWDRLQEFFLNSIQNLKRKSCFTMII
jgi:hypothetical protein